MTGVLSSVIMWALTASSRPASFISKHGAAVYELGVDETTVTMAVGTSTRGCFLCGLAELAQYSEHRITWTFSRVLRCMLFPLGQRPLRRTPQRSFATCASAPEQGSPTVGPTCSS